MPGFAGSLPLPFHGRPALVLAIVLSTFLPSMPLSLAHDSLALPALGPLMGWVTQQAASLTPPF